MREGELPLAMAEALGKQKAGAFFDSLTRGYDRMLTWVLDHQPLTLLVGYNPGGPVDIVARQLAEHLRDGAAILAAATPPDLSAVAQLSADFDHLRWFDLPASALQD